MAELISVIVTTYNRDDALDAVLRSLAGQGDTDFEVIVADDGSGAATAKRLSRWKAKLGRRLEHVWHADHGFRAAEIRNRAILAARGTYCIFLDGDCIVRPDFVGTHRRLAEPGWFVTGNRILLSRELTAKVLEGKSCTPESWKLPRWLAERLRGGINRLSAFCICRWGRCAGSVRGHGKVHARAISPSGVPISIASTVSMPTTAAGARKIRTLSCACYMPASVERTGLLQPACSIFGTKMPTDRNCQRMNESLPVSPLAIAFAHAKVYQCFRERLQPPLP